MNHRQWMETIEEMDGSHSWPRPLTLEAYQDTNSVYGWSYLVECPKCNESLAFPTADKGGYKCWKCGTAFWCKYEKEIMIIVCQHEDKKHIWINGTYHADIEKGVEGYKLADFRTK